MNCLIYARVSTDKQADKELSIPAQLHACRQYATQRNWIVSEEFVELGVSARTANRPKLHELLALCRKSDEINVVLVHKIDRLARNVADHAIIRALLRQRGIRLASVVENLDDSVSGQLVEHVMAAIAEFHSSNLSEETKKGMRQKVMQGGWPHRPPRGYRVHRDAAKSSVVIDPLEGPLIASAFELYSSGWYSVKRLSRHLANRGLTSRSKTPLAPSHLRRLLKNPFYVGRLVWKNLQLPGRHEPLISPQLFDRVQQVFASRRTERRHTKGPAEFSLRLVGLCATCHGRMTVERHRRWSYYRCTRQAYRRDRCAARYCPTSKAHADFERICRSIRVDDTRSLWDIYAPLNHADRLRLVGQLFESVTLSVEGINKFELKPLWLKAVLDQQRLLSAA